jgi:bifunctional DNA-binding transcriptional regulator/antitoxin component of YhaV-PrlF toxin-antitoxin module
MKKPTTVQFIVYSDGNEVIVCKPSSEKETLKLYFQEGSPRNLEEYLRKEIYDVTLLILPTVSVY